jgi:hypothetical protein
MVKQTGLWIAGVLFNEFELVGHIFQELQLVESQSIFCIERGGHVKPVQPHLKRIDFLMPEASALGTGLLLELAVQELERFGITLITGAPVKRKQELARIDLVEIELAGTIGANITLLGHEVIHPVMDKVLKTFIACSRANSRKGLHKQAMLIVPLPFA